MTTIDRTAYPRFKTKEIIPEKELAKIYTPSEKEKDFVFKNANGIKNQFQLMLFLKSFQRLGYFVKLENIPEIITKHIADEVGISNFSLSCPHSTKIRYYDKVREFFKVTAYGEEVKNVVIEILTKRAQVIDRPADLINIAVEKLIEQKYELPAFSTLARLAGNIRSNVNLVIFEQISDLLGPDKMNYFNKILTKEDEYYVTLYNCLKQAPKNPTLQHLRELLDHFQWLMSFGDIDLYLKNIGPAKIKCFASEAKVLDASEMKDINLKKRVSLIICLIHQSRTKNRDYIAEMLIKRMSKIHKRGNEELESIRENHRKQSEKLLDTFGHILKNMSSEERSDDQKLNSIKSILQKNGGPEQLLQEYEKISAYNNNNYLPLLWKFYKSHRSAIFLLLKSIDIKSTTQDNSLIKAMDFMMKNETKRSEFLEIKSNSFLSFTSNKWRSVILKKEKGKLFMNRRHFEVCVLSCLASELLSLDLYIEGSESFADYRKQLLSLEECKLLMDNYCREVGISNNTNDSIANLKRLLVRAGKKVDKSYNKNGDFEIDKNGIPILKKIKAKRMPLSAKRLEQIIISRMPERNILDILVNVSHWTDFTRHFGPQSGNLPKIANDVENYLIATFAYGCNMGPTQASRHLDNRISPHSISFANKKHINAKKLENALKDTINNYNLFELPKLWGSQNTAIADGTQFDLYERNLMSESHIRYGGHGGIAYYHISDTYIALFSHFIPCGVWEAIYIIEGLLKNKSDIQIDTVHADTQGQSAIVFALCYLLGIKLEPRIRNWKDLKFYRPDKHTKYNNIDNLFTDVTNWDLIEKHWMDMMQVVLSIKEGKISSAVLLRRLGNYSKKNKLYQAFRELGRVVRTIFLLDYISDNEKRQQITASTNKIESYNQFSQWFFFGLLGVISSNYFDEQEKAIKYNDLIANIVMLQNVADMSMIVQDLRKSGIVVNDEDLAFFSPYTTSSTKRFGNYNINMMNKPPDLEEFIRISV